MKGIWKQVFGTGSANSLLSYAKCETREDALERIETCPFPLDQPIESEQVLERFVLRIPCQKCEQFYGLGLNFEKLTLGMAVRHLRMDHYGGYDNGRTHVPTPFYLSNAGYGIFVDVAEPISFYMSGAVRLDAENPPLEMNRGRDDDWQCDQPSEFVEASIEGHGADVYIIAGLNMTDVVSRFNLLCGGGCLPPKWGLGFWHRMGIKSDEPAIHADLEAYDLHGIKVDVLGLEPGWQSNSYPCTFEWDLERFPNPARFIRQLLNRNVHINLWENMYVSQKAAIYPDLKPYFGSHLVWGGAVVDLVTENAGRLLMEQHDREHISLGVSGYKIDECDGSDAWLWPDHARFPSGTPALIMRQIYGLRLQQLLDEQYRKNNRRTYGLVRASNAGASSLPFGIYNDCYDFDQYLSGMLSAGFAGVLWVPEIRSADTAQEWVRRFQLAALSPMLQLDAWANNVKPWDFPEVESAVKEAITLRRTLLPYLYQSFAEYHFKGIPPFRALVMDYPYMNNKKADGQLDHTNNPYQLARTIEVTDQYMIGKSMMFAPVRPEAFERDVALPAGQWHDFFTGEPVHGDQVIHIICPLERILLYVKADTMVPTQGPERNELLVRCYGNKGQTTFYDDDGETFAYESGQHALIHCQFVRENGQLHGTSITENCGYETLYTKIRFA